MASAHYITGARVSSSLDEMFRKRFKQEGKGKEDGEEGETGEEKMKGNGKEGKEERWTEKKDGEGKKSRYCMDLSVAVIRHHG